MEAGTGVHPFTLTDARGGAHNYLVTEHPAGEGMEIMFGLLGLGAPSVVGLVAVGIKSVDVLKALFGALAGGEEEGIQKINGADWAILAALFKDVDLSTVGLEIGKALGTGKAPELARRILSRTLRDGKPLFVAGNGQAFEQAYQANYGELLQAVFRVCAINRFFPLPGTFPGSPAGS